MKLKLHWYWGFIGSLGVLGYILKEPLYYTLFAFLLFFIEPLVKPKK